MSKFRITWDVENGETVYRVYYEGCSHHWYKTKFRNYAQQYIEDMEKYMRGETR